MKDIKEIIRQSRLLYASTTNFHFSFLDALHRGEINENEIISIEDYYESETKRNRDKSSDSPEKQMQKAQKKIFKELMPEFNKAYLKFL